MNSNAEFNTIAELDLDPIKVKLMHKESGEGWTLEQANAVEFEYRRFLCLMKLFPHEQTAPLFDVDIFWHYHILDTMKYAADCEQIFGYFLHHFPYVGLRGEDDEVTHHRVGVRMQELYEATFGETYIRQEEAHEVQAIAVNSMTAALNDPVDPLRAPSGVARTAYSIATIQNNPVDSARPALTAAKTAYSIAAILINPVESVRPALTAAKTAYSIAAIQTNSVASVRPALRTANTAYSIAAALNDSVYSLRPTFGTAKTAYSIASVQSDSFFSTRPTLANAA
jgi:hypothetical protein